MKKLFALFILLQLGDGILTYFGVALGAAEELNPLWTSVAQSGIGIAIIKTLGVIGIAICLDKLPITTAKKLLAATNVLFIAVVINNLISIS